MIEWTWVHESLNPRSNPLKRTPSFLFISPKSVLRLLCGVSSLIYIWKKQGGNPNLHISTHAHTHTHIPLEKSCLVMFWLNNFVFSLCFFWSPTKMFVFSLRFGCFPLSFLNFEFLLLPPPPFFCFDLSPKFSPGKWEERKNLDEFGKTSAFTLAVFQLFRMCLCACTPGCMSV